MNMLNRLFCRATLFFFVLGSGSVYSFEFKPVAATKWVSYSTQNFNLVTDLERENAIYLLKDLELYRYFITEIVGVRLNSDIPALPILAIANHRTFSQIGLPEGIGGVFKTGASGYAALVNVIHYSPEYHSTSTARHTLLHEYFHFLTFFSDYESLNFPGWYIEGMAEYWATFKSDGNQFVVGDPAPLADRIFDLFSDRRGDYLINSEQLLSQAIPSLKDDSEKGKLALGRFYARSFFLVHYLNSSAGLRAATAAYVKALNAGLSNDDAFRASFDTTYTKLDQALNDYIVKSQYMSRVFQTDIAERALAPDIAMKKLSKPERYHLIASIFWDFDLVDISASKRKSMLKAALKKNKGDPVLRAYLEMFEDS